MPSTMGQGDGQLMRAAARTPKFDDAAMNQKTVQPMEESLAQEAISGRLKRDVSGRGPLQVDKPRVNPLMKRVMGKKVRKSKTAPSAFMGDFGEKPNFLPSRSDK